MSNVQIKDCGLICLNNANKNNSSHLFINGFMSDELEDYKAKDWQDGLKDILNQDEQKFIFKWESGLDYSSLRNHIPFKNGLDFELKRIKHIAKTYNKSLAYNNLRVDIPSPIGHPGNNQSKNFTQEVEVISLQQLLDKLKNSCTLFLNYHSVGGLIYQRPENDDKFITSYNYILSKFYQENTIKNASKYDIVKGQSGRAISVNDQLRQKYPGNILVELSPMGGNPIGPFGDPNNIKSTIESNIQSFIYTMSNLNKVITLTNQSLENNATNIEETYKSIDEVYEQSKKSR